MKPVIIIRAYCYSCRSITEYQNAMPPSCPTHKTKLCDLSSPPRTTGGTLTLSLADRRFLRSMHIEPPADAVAS